VTKVKRGRKDLSKGRARDRTGNSRAFAPNSSPASPDFAAIMQRFSQALSLVIVCHRSLAAQESASADVGDEEETLRRGIRLLKDVYNEVDRASWATRKSS
jgi:hypothetical protein